MAGFIRSKWLGQMRIVIAAAILCANVPDASAQMRVRYPRPENAADARSSYPLAVLQLCVAQSPGTLQIEPSRFRAQQGRNIRQLIQNDGLDVIWSVPDEQRIRTLLPVYIPIDRGLIGWRLLLIRNADQEKFASIASAQQLAALSAGQGHDWPDVAILRANGLRVDTSTTYEGIFGMLQLGHIQYFPRSLSEIWPELNAHQDKALAVQDSLALHYRSGLFFFVNINNASLAAALTSCLRTATERGSLRDLFYRFHGDAIARARLSQRRILELETPALITDMSMLPPTYWFSPSEAAP